MRPGKNSYIFKKIKNEKVLITGHSGFIGSWLFHILTKKKIKTFGLGLKHKKTQDLFHLLGLEKNKNSSFINILDYPKLRKFIKRHKPTTIIHLAAESLVIKAFNNPYKAYNTNIIGTLNILKSIREFNFINNAIFFTSDKVYANDNYNKKFLENDHLGGDDPYSGSKSGSEMVINSFVRSYLQKKKIITVRCGNIIGGGDENENRLIPDIIKSFRNKKTLLIRNKNATRPWQYILDVIFALIKMLNFLKIKKSYFDVVNIGPMGKNLSVNEVVKEFKDKFKIKVKYKKQNNYEKKFLSLNSLKLKKKYSITNLHTSKNAIKKTIIFYEKLLIKKNKIQEIVDEEIKSYKNYG